MTTMTIDGQTQVAALELEASDKEFEAAAIRVYELELEMTQARHALRAATRRLDSAHDLDNRLRRERMR